MWQPLAYGKYNRLLDITIECFKQINGAVNQNWWSNLNKKKPIGKKKKFGRVLLAHIKGCDNQLDTESMTDIQRSTTECFKLTSRAVTALLHQNWCANINNSRAMGEDKFSRGLLVHNKGFDNHCDKGSTTVFKAVRKSASSLETVL